MAEIEEARTGRVLPEVNLEMRILGDSDEDKWCKVSEKVEAMWRTSGEEGKTRGPYTRSTRHISTQILTHPSHPAVVTVSPFLFMSLTFALFPPPSSPVIVWRASPVEHE